MGLQLPDLAAIINAGKQRRFIAGQRSAEGWQDAFSKMFSGMAESRRNKELLKSAEGESIEPESPAPDMDLGGVKALLGMAPPEESSVVAPLRPPEEAAAATATPPPKPRRSFAGMSNTALEDVIKKRAEGSSSPWEAMGRAIDVDDKPKAEWIADLIQGTRAEKVRAAAALKDMDLVREYQQKIRAGTMTPLDMLAYKELKEILALKGGGDYSLINPPTKTSRGFEGEYDALKRALSGGRPKATPPAATEQAPPDVIEAFRTGRAKPGTKVKKNGILWMQDANGNIVPTR